MFDLKKQHEYLLCIDSDGCAMDSMTIKHRRCFGPCMIDCWNLGKWYSDIQKRWEEINLYTVTRGINRFKGLAIALSEININYTSIEDIDTLCRWVDNAEELSNRALEAEITINDSIILKKALLWSENVNKQISGLDIHDKKVFNFVRSSLEKAHINADIVIVSSANKEAVEEEWKIADIMRFTSLTLSQNAGSKDYCISQLLKRGYSPNKVIMLGDAMGDLKAAMDNGILFYPILPQHETYSWHRFFSDALDKFISDEYEGDYMQACVSEFKNLLL